MKLYESEKVLLPLMIHENYLKKNPKDEAFYSAPANKRAQSLNRCIVGVTVVWKRSAMQLSYYSYWAIWL